MIRCCLCRCVMHSVPDFETTDLPGSGWRCLDHEACASRVREIVTAHVSLAEALR
jgi:hypothetical protein